LQKQLQGQKMSQNMKKFMLGLLVLFVAVKLIAAIGSGTSTTQPTETQQNTKDLSKVELVFEVKFPVKNIAQFSGRISNLTGKAIKNPVLLCEFYSENKTTLTSKKETIFIDLNPFATKEIQELNFGFVHDQTNSYNCAVIDYQEA
jgi:hypothetical protein